MNFTENVSLLRTKVSLDKRYLLETATLTPEAKELNERMESIASINKRLHKGSPVSHTELFEAIDEMWEAKKLLNQETQKEWDTKFLSSFEALLAHYVPLTDDVLNQLDTDHEVTSSAKANNESQTIALTKAYVPATSAAKEESTTHIYERMWMVMSDRTKLMLDNVNSFLDMAEAKNKRAAELNKKLQLYRNWKEQYKDTRIKHDSEWAWLKKNGFWPKSGGDDWLNHGQLEAIVQNMTTAIQTLGQEGELNLIKLQSSLNSFQQTQELLSNFVKKMADLLSSIIRNVS